MADAQQAVQGGFERLSAGDAAQHREHLEACARLGGAPVLCEKPIALTVGDTQATVDLLREGGVPVQVGFQRRFDPALRAARDNPRLAAQVQSLELQRSTLQ